MYQCISMWKRLKNWSGYKDKGLYSIVTRSKGKKNAKALEDLLPAFKATARPCQSTIGDPLEPPLVPEADCRNQRN